VLCSASSAQAATFTVNSPADAPDANPGDGVCATRGGNCSLRAAIDEANRAPSSDEIGLPPDRYTITGARNDDSNASGDFDVAAAGSLTLDGSGDPGSTVLDGAGLDRVVHVLADATLTLSDVTVSNGFVPLVAGSTTAGDGGGMFNSSNATLTVTRSVVTNNRAGDDSGAIGNGAGASLTVTATTIATNVAGDDGGGTDNVGPSATFVDSMLVDNVADTGDGGAIDTSAGTLTISRSTLTDNRAGDAGGAVDNRGTDATITSSTLTRNVSNFTAGTGPAPATGAGGAIRHIAPADGASSRLRVVDSTITSNEARVGDPTDGADGGGVYASQAVSLENTRLAANRDEDGPNNCDGPGPFTFNGNRLERGADCGSAAIVESPTVRDTKPPRISARLPRGRCLRRDFSLRVTIRDRSALRVARVFVNGRRVRKTRRMRFRERIRASRLRRGRHRITVRATDASGNRARATRHFRRC
jgi:CSLREA domain-containing protein